MLKFIDIKIMVTKEITKELVEKQMNSTLSYFPWGGKEMEPWWLTRYWEAANNMREPTFPESMDFFDPNAPRSPYILAKIKASMEKHHTLRELQEMWDNFSNTPINNDDEIEMPFYFWESGTSRFEIWHWFDKLCPNGLAVDLMGETPKTVF